MGAPPYLESLPVPPDSAWQVTPPVVGEGGGGVPRTQQLLGVIFPPDQTRPLGAQDVYGIAPIGTLVGPGPAAVSAPLGRYVVPPGMVARIASFSVQVLNMIPATNITWRLRVNQQSAGPWGVLQIPAAPLAVASRSFDVYVLAFERSVIDMVVQVDDVAAYVVQPSFSGWQYSLRQHQAYYGAQIALLGG